MTIVDDILMGTSKNRPYSSNATKLPANDSASFPFRFINVHSEAVSDRQRDQFFEVPLCHFRGLVCHRAKSRRTQAGFRIRRTTRGIQKYPDISRHRRVGGTSGETLAPRTM